MARARAEGRKAVTRRVVKPQPEFGRASIGGPYLDDVNVFRVRTKEGNWHVRDPISFTEDCCPYVGPGDRIRWLTTWAAPIECDGLKPRQLPEEFAWYDSIWSYHASAIKPERFGKLRPGRFLPRFLRGRMPVDEIVSVRVERLQDITEEDAIKEGVEILKPGFWKAYNCKAGFCVTAKRSFETLWHSINGTDSWDSNPWVWRIEFKPLNHIPAATKKVGSLASETHAKADL